MLTSWTPEQVLHLAPDETSRANASELANRRRWLELFWSEDGGHPILWGECPGSGAEPYRCQVDPEGPVLKCSCPSRKLPCKHALALFLLYTRQPEMFETSAPPDWLSAWITRRAAQNERRAAKPAAHETTPAEEKTRRSMARAAARDGKIRAGLDELEIWLHDLLRQGLADAQSAPPAFWETAAARLVDAQAPGLARMVRGLAGHFATGEGWQDRMLESIARLYLVMEGYRRIDCLPEENQADLRAAVGITLKQEDLLACPGMQDTWLVLGRSLNEEAGLLTQRTWLLGQSSGRPALVLNFAPKGGVLGTSLAPGMAVKGELVFYPGAHPLRAIVREQESAGLISPAVLSAAGFRGLVEATQSYARALSAVPWIERYPMAIQSMRPRSEGGEWALYDAENRRAPLHRRFLQGWTMLALSGGQPLSVFGEWDSERLDLLSAWTKDQFHAFHAETE